MSDDDILTGSILGRVQRFIRNTDDSLDALCQIECTDDSAEEIELGWTLERDRYYLRVRKDDLRRLLADEVTP
jgi:hypothetical protein